MQKRDQKLDGGMGKMADMTSLNEVLQGRTPRQFNQDKRVMPICLASAKTRCDVKQCVLVAMAERQSR